MIREICVSYICDALNAHYSFVLLKAISGALTITSCRISQSFQVWCMDYGFMLCISIMLKFFLFEYVSSSSVSILGSYADPDKLFYLKFVSRTDGFHLVITHLI